MAWVKFTLGRVVTVDSDNNQVTVTAGSNIILYDPDGRKSETDDAFDEMSQEWGSFAQDEDMIWFRPEITGTSASAEQTGKFVGTYQDSYGNTIYVITWEDPDYGTYYGLISPGNGTGSATTLNNRSLINEFTAKGGVNGLTDPPHAVPCFLSGTMIATPSGERRVEELVTGDPVLVEDSITVPTAWVGRMARKLRRSLGFRRTVPVKWIGRQTVSKRFGPAHRLMPVRFSAGSLGGGGGYPLLPHSDLTVTADHAVLVDGVLCEAGALVNGSSVKWVPLSDYGESYTVYHVETDSHEIIIANGAPAETFIDNASRRAFDNYAEFEALYGENPPEMVELPHPRAANARHLPKRIRDRFRIAGSDDEGRAA